MRNLFLLLLFVLCLVGCSGSGGAMDIGGTWAKSDGQSQLTFTFAKDQTFSMVAGNQSAAGVLLGKYELSGDKLTLKPNEHMGAPPMGYKVSMSGTQLTLVSTSTPEEKFVLAKVGPVRDTAVAGTSSASPGSSTPPIDEAKLHEAANRTTCGSNMKQLGMAMMMYAADYNAFPPSDDWAGRLKPYTKQDYMFTCPSLKKEGKQGGYSMNAALSGAEFKSIPNPQKVVLLFESGEGNGSGDPSSAVNPPRHEKGWVVYADGHTKAQ